MGINEKGEFVREESLGSQPDAKTPEQLQREAQIQEVRRRIAEEESLEGMPEDIVAEVRQGDQGLAARRRQIRESLKNTKPD